MQVWGVNKFGLHIFTSHNESKLMDKSKIIDRPESSKRLDRSLLNLITNYFIRNDELPHKKIGQGSKT